MANDPVSNQNRAIATRGTKHKAKTVRPMDACHPAAEPSKIAKFDNEICTKDHVDPATNTTASTVISGYRIWIDKGLVGPISDPPHPPWDTGGTSKRPYRGPATNRTCSDTVFFESRGAVRTDDGTLQNHENTVGKVDGSEVEVTAELTEDYYKNACRIGKFTGTIPAKPASSGSALANAGGKLANQLNPAPPPANAVAAEAVVFGDAAGVKTARGEFYIEIHNGTEIEFEVERWDLTKTPTAKAGQCKQYPDHAHWLGVDKKGKVKDRTTGDKYKLGKSLTDVGLELEPDSIGVDTKGTGSGLGGVGLSVPMGPRGAMKTEDFFRAKDKPPMLKVRAGTCGDVRDTIVAIKPAGKFEISISLEKEDEDTSTNDKKMKGLRSIQTTVEQVREIKQLLRNGKKIFEAVRKATHLAGRIVEPKFDYHFLDNVTFALTCEYKRCTRSGTALISKQPYTIYHVRPAWTFSVSAAPFFGVELGVEIDIISLVAAIVSGGTLSTITSALKKVGINILLLTVTFSVGLDITINLGLDQHEDPLGESTSIEGAIPIALAVAIKTSFGEGETSLVEVSLEFKGSVTGRLIGMPATMPNTVMRIRWSVDFATQCKFTGKVWRFEKPFGPWEGPSFKPSPQEKHIPWPS